VTGVWKCWGCDRPTTSTMIIGDTCVAACSPECAAQAHRDLSADPVPMESEQDH
jgi:lipoate synthase